MTWHYDSDNDAYWGANKLGTMSTVVRFEDGWTWGVPLPEGDPRGLSMFGHAPTSTAAMEAADGAVADGWRPEVEG